MTLDKILASRREKGTTKRLTVYLSKFHFSQNSLKHSFRKLIIILNWQNLQFWSMLFKYKLGGVLSFFWTIILSSLKKQHIFSKLVHFTGATTTTCLRIKKRKIEDFRLVFSQNYHCGMPPIFFTLVFLRWAVLWRNIGLVIWYTLGGLHLDAAMRRCSSEYSWQKFWKHLLENIFSVITCIEMR